MSSTIIETDTCLLDASMNLTIFRVSREKGEAEMKEKCERIEMFIYEFWTTKLTFFLIFLLVSHPAFGGLLLRSGPSER